MADQLLPDPNTLDWATGDLKRKGAHQGPEPRKQRKLSPEMEKQFNEATPLSAFLRNTANAFSLNQADRLATITGAPLEEQHELSERLDREAEVLDLRGCRRQRGACCPLEPGSGASGSFRLWSQHV